MQDSRMSRRMTVARTSRYEPKKQSKAASFFSSLKLFLQSIWPFIKFVFFAKISKNVFDEDSEIPKLTTTKKTFYELKRKKIRFERLCFLMNPSESRGATNVTIQPVRRRQAQLLLIVRAQRFFLMASAGFEYFTNRKVIFNKVWRGHQDLMQRCMYEKMITFPEKYRKKIEQRESGIRKHGTTTSISSSGHSPSMGLSSGRGKSIGISSRGSTKSKSELTSEVSHKSDRSRTTRSMESQSPTNITTSYFNMERSVFVLEMPVGFSSGLYFGSDESKLTPEEYMYLLDASKFIKYTFSDPLLLFYQDWCVKSLIIFIVICIFFISMALFTTTQHKSHPIPILVIIPTLLCFCYSLLKTYDLQFDMLQRWTLWKMGKRHKVMQTKYEKAHKNPKNRIPKLEMSDMSLTDAMKASKEKTKKRSKDLSLLLTNIYHVALLVGFAFCLLLLCILSGKQVFSLLLVPLIVFICAFCSINYRFIVWKTVISNYLCQFILTCFVFNGFLWPYFDRFISSSETVINEVADILPTKVNVSYSIVLRFFAIFIVFNFVLEALMYFEFFQYCNRISSWISLLMGVTDIEASYLLMGIFTSYKHLIRANSNLLTRLTQSELHILIVAGLVNCPLPELCAYTMLGIPLSTMIAFNVLTVPGSVATAKLLFPEIQISLTAKRRLFPKKEPVTIQTRLLTDVWISSIALATKTLFVQVFVCIIMITSVKIINSMLFESQEEGRSNDIFDIFSTLLQPLTYCLGITSAADRHFFVSSIMKRLFINDMLAVFALSEKLHFSWLTSCLSFINGEKVEKGMLSSPGIMRFLKTFMSGEVYNDEYQMRTLFIAVPLVCSFASIARIFISTSHMASVLPRNRQASLTSIGFRALGTAFVSKIILAIFAGSVFNAANEIKCVTEWYSGFDKNRASFCMDFIKEFPRETFTNSTELVVTRPFGTYEIVCFRLRNFGFDEN